VFNARFQAGPLDYQSIESGRTLGGQAPCIVEEFTQCFHLSLAITLGRVEQHGQTGPVQMVDDLTNPPVLSFCRRRAFDHRVGYPINKPQLKLINIQFLMIELRLYKAPPIFEDEDEL